jgi:flagellar hook assembly protein FlgD
MAILPATNSSTTTNGSTPSAAEAINDLDLNAFLKLMITELQQQDPLNPLDNKDMLNQISQIRAIGASDKLTKTLDSVLLGQNIASATNLIGADVSALSDDGQPISGVVNRISIDKGVPKLHVENLPSISLSGTQGNIDAGTYGYRVVWTDENTGQLVGMEWSGDNAIKTTGTAGIDRSVQLNNLPITSTAKRVYRTDGSENEPYQLLGTITDGKQSAYVDSMADSERSNTKLTQPFGRATFTPRSFDVTLNNISAVRPPSVGSSGG